MTGRTDVYDSATARVIAALERGTAPWHRPWKLTGGVPRSMSTRRPYRGVNALLLGMAAQDGGYASPWWGTYRQVQERGGNVRRGEKSTEIYLWKPVTRSHRDDETGGQDDGRPSSYLLAQSFRVFNSEQCDRLESLTPTAAQETDPIASCDAIVASYVDRDGPKITHGGDAAAYSPLTDLVRMPRRENFESPEHYYSTLFHELTHSTGHASRLHREGITEGHRFGDADYSREELVAEMGAAMLCALAGIDNAAVLEENAAYLSHWVQVLRGGHRLVISAAAQAQRAADLICGPECAAEVAA